MRRARKHDNVLRGGAWKVSSGSRQGKEGCQAAPEGQTSVRLAAFFEEIRVSCEGAFDTCGNNAIFCAFGRNNIAFCRRKLTGSDYRRGRRLACASRVGLPRARLAGEEKKK
jgi:hypothetical protein